MTYAPPSVSVIVPVFNTRNYLQECVESIEGQDFESFEIVLVNDGSTDDSGELCEQLARKYSNITVIHKQNGGLSDARNCGVQNALYDWVCFVDSDDVVSASFLSCLVAPIMNDNVQMSTLPTGVSFTNGQQPQLSKAGHANVGYDVLTAEQYVEEILYQRIANASQFRLIRKAIVLEDPFPKGVLYEDMATTYRFAHSCDKIALLRTSSLYGYRINQNGITRSSYSHKKCESAIWVTRRLKDEIDKWYPNLSCAANARCFSTLRTIYAQASDARSRDAEQLWRELLLYSPSVSKDKKARFRDRLSAQMASFGRQQFTFFCSACRRIGLIV